MVAVLCDGGGAGGATGRVMGRAHDAGARWACWSSRSRQPTYSSLSGGCVRPGAWRATTPPHRGKAPCTRTLVPPGSTAAETANTPAQVTTTGHHHAQDATHIRTQPAPSAPRDAVPCIGARSRGEQPEAESPSLHLTSPKVCNGKGGAHSALRTPLGVGGKQPAARVLRHERSMASGLSPPPAPPAAPQQRASGTHSNNMQQHCAAPQQQEAGGQPTHTAADLDGGGVLKLLPPNPIRTQRATRQVRWGLKGGGRGRARGVS